MSTIDTQRQLSSAFHQLGHPSLPSSLLTKLSNLSESLHLTPKELVDAWEAHSLTKNVDSLNEASFGGFRLALSKLAGGGTNASNAIVMSGTGLGKRSSNMAGVTPSPMAKRGTQNAANATTGATTPAANSKLASTSTSNANATTANRDGRSAIDNLTTPSGKGTAASVITPIPHSTNTTFKSPPPTIKYTERTNSGEIVSTYNPHNLSTSTELLSTKSEEERKEFTVRRVCNISVLPTPAASSTTSSAATSANSHRHMFTPLEKRSIALEHRLLDMNNAICEMYSYKSEEDEMMELSMENGLISSSGTEGEGRNDVMWTPVGLPKQNKVVCVGRICNEVRVFVTLYIESVSCIDISQFIRNYLPNIVPRLPLPIHTYPRLTKDDSTVPRSNWKALGIIP